MQKYEVFTEKGGIFFNNSDRFEEKLDKTYGFKDLPKPEVLASAGYKDLKIGVICKDIPADFETFKKGFDEIHAAGGWVCKENELLWIKRNGFWDLPKGKAEKGESIMETALREVEEECGIADLEVLNPEPVLTFHIYHNPYTQLPTLKTTFWFEMNYAGPEVFLPQEEEGIEEVKFISFKEKYPLEQTFPSILSLFKQLNPR